MASIFSRIVSGEIPSYRIAESDQFYAFLDINPLKMGHTLVILKEEIDYLFDLNAGQIGEMMIFTQRVAKAIEKTIPCLRVGVAVIGLEVPHVHIHLIPIDKEEDMLFSNPKLKFEPLQMEQIAHSIVLNFD